MAFVVEAYKIVIDQQLVDQALSGSKGHNRTRGRLKDLLDMVDEGSMPPGTPLIIESMSRLSREEVLDVAEVLKTLIINGGMILITGDLTIWDSWSINTSMNHKLWAEINAAREFAENLASYARSVHSRIRERLAKFAMDPDGPTPMLNSRPPAWIVRTPGPQRGYATYALHPDYAAVVQLIFDLCKQDYSALQIADELNRRGIKTFEFGKKGGTEWRAPRVGMLLRDKLVIGFVQPCLRDGNKHVRIGESVKLYPHSIDAATWVTVRDILDNRQSGLRGRRGTTCPNLFTGRVFCGTCTGALRAATAGPHDRGAPWRKLVCARVRESGTCADPHRYDLDWFEKRLLVLLANNAAPRKQQNGDKEALLENLSALRTEVVTLNENADVMQRDIGSSPSRRARWNQITEQIDRAQKEIADLEMKIAAADQPTSRLRDLVAFLKTLIAPALGGDVEVRKRLRSLLTRVDYRIVGSGDDLVLTMGDTSFTIKAGGRGVMRQDAAGYYFENGERVPADRIRECGGFVIYEPGADPCC